MRLILADPDPVAAWVAQRIPQMAGMPFAGVTWAIGVEADNGVPLGGVVFSNHVPAWRTIDISFASESPRWLTKRLISGIMAYPFDQLGVRRLTSYTPKKNKRARTFIDTFGFVREGCLWRGCGTDDVIVSRFSDRDWTESRFNMKRVKPIPYGVGTAPILAEGHKDPSESFVGQSVLIQERVST